MKCNNCYFYDKCVLESNHISVEMCSHFFPLDDELCNAIVESATDTKRKEYYDEYIIYASQYDDDLFFW